MNIRVLLVFFLPILTACGNYLTHNTVEEVNKPRSRTSQTKLQMEQVGDSAGVRIDEFMNKVEAQISTSEGVTLVPYSEGFIVILNSEFLFDEESHQTKECEKCNAIFNTLKKSPYLNYLVEVHTDGDGTRYYNQFLSERRADSIEALLESLDFPMDRLTIKAYGEDQPIAENSYEWGKYLNRRIEIAVYANQQLKDLATNGQIPSF